MKMVSVSTLCILVLGILEVWVVSGSRWEYTHAKNKARGLYDHLSTSAAQRIDPTQYPKTPTLGVHALESTDEQSGAFDLLKKNSREDSTLFSHGVMAGDVTSTSVVLWTRVAPSKSKRAVPLRVSLECSYTRQGPSRRTRVCRRTYKCIAKKRFDHTCKVQVVDLPAAASCTYFFHNRQNTKRSNVGHFKTAPAFSLTDIPPLEFTWGGDADSENQLLLGGEFEALNGMASHTNQDFFVYMGDTVYQDHPFVLPDTGDIAGASLNDYRNAYKQQYSDARYKTLFASHAGFHQWDDHEVDNDFDLGWNDTETQRNKYTWGERAFLENAPIARQPHAGGDTVYADQCFTAPLVRKFGWGLAASMIYLDTHTCRSDHSAIIGQCLDPATPLGVDLLPRAPDAIRAQALGPVYGGSENVPNITTCRDAVNNADCTILGDAQTSLLKEYLLSSPGLLKLIFTPTPMDEQYVNPWSRWEQCPKARKELLEWVLDQPGLADRIIWITTDEHDSRIGPVFVDVLHGDTRTVGLQFIAPPIAVPPTGKGFSLIFGETLGPFLRASWTSWFNNFPVMVQNIDEFGYGHFQLTPTATGLSLAISLRDKQGNLMPNQLNLTANVGVPRPPVAYIPIEVPFPQLKSMAAAASSSSASTGSGTASTVVTVGVGAVLGAVLAIAAMFVIQKRRQRESAPAGNEDQEPTQLESVNLSDLVAEYQNQDA